MASKAALGPPPSLNKAAAERLSPYSSSLSCRSPAFLFLGHNKTQGCSYLTLVSHIKFRLLVRAMVPYFGPLFQFCPKVLFLSLIQGSWVTWLSLTIIYVTVISIIHLPLSSLISKCTVLLILSWFRPSNPLLGFGPSFKLGSVCQAFLNASSATERTLSLECALCGFMYAHIASFFSTFLAQIQQMLPGCIL